MHRYVKISQNLCQQSLQSNIARRFALYTVMCSSVIALIITTIQLTLDYREGINDIEKNLESVELSFIPSIEQSLWHIDEVLIASQLAGVARLSGIAGVQIETTERTYARSYAADSPDDEKHSYPLAHSEQGRNFPLGTLTVITSRSEVYDSLMQSAAFVLFSNTIKTLIVSGAILVIFQLLVGRHLSRISSFAENTLPDQAQHLVIHRNYHSRDELTTVVNAINSWIDSQHEYFLHEEQLKDDLKQDRDRLDDKNKQILATSKEIEEFAYRTSHDLKAPLMSNARLVELIQEDLANNNLVKGQENLALVAQSLRKLNKLVSDMLVLSSVSEVQTKGQPLAISSLARDSIQRCCQTYQTKRLYYTSSVEGLKSFTTQSRHMTFILDNLLSNATKYSINTGRTPEIKLHIIVDKEGLTLSVKDNGIGIPKQHANDIFAMFRRFHPKHASGSGLGLYMVKRSVEQLNGQIKYTSLAVGTEFQVFIPAIRSV